MNDCEYKPKRHKSGNLSLLDNCVAFLVSQFLPGEDACTFPLLCRRMRATTLSLNLTLTNSNIYRKGAFLRALQRHILRSVELRTVDCELAHKLFKCCALPTLESLRLCPPACVNLALATEPLARHFSALKSLKTLELSPAFPFIPLPQLTDVTLGAVFDHVEQAALALLWTIPLVSLVFYSVDLDETIAWEPWEKNSPTSSVTPFLSSPPAFSQSLRKLASVHLETLDILMPYCQQLQSLGCQWHDIAKKNPGLTELRVNSPDDVLLSFPKLQKLQIVFTGHQKGHLSGMCDELVEIRACHFAPASMSKFLRRATKLTSVRFECSWNDTVHALNNINHNNCKVRCLQPYTREPLLRPHIVALLAKGYCLEEINFINAVQKKNWAIALETAPYLKGCKSLHGDRGLFKFFGHPDLLTPLSNSLSALSFVCHSSVITGTHIQNVLDVCHSLTSLTIDLTRPAYHPKSPITLKLRSLSLHHLEISSFLTRACSLRLTNLKSLQLRSDGSGYALENLLTDIINSPPDSMNDLPNLEDLRLDKKSVIGNHQEFYMPKQVKGHSKLRKLCCKGLHLSSIILQNLPFMRKVIFEDVCGLKRVWLALPWTCDIILQDGRDKEIFVKDGVGTPPRNDKCCNVLLVIGCVRCLRTGSEECPVCNQSSCQSRSSNSKCGHAIHCLKCPDHT